MAKSERNVLISPFSIYFQLVFMYLGAVDETAEEMKKFLNFPDEREKLLEGMRQLLDELKVKKNSYSIVDVYFEPIKSSILFSDIASMFSYGYVRTTFFQTTS